MHLNFLASIIAVRRRRYLRAMMRGYRLLRQSGRLGVFHKLKNDFTTRDLGFEAAFFSNTLLFGALELAELVLRQYLLSKSAGVNLNRALLVSLGMPNASVAYAMPRQWRLLVEAYGFRVSHWRCALLWWGYVCVMFAGGIVRSLRMVILWLTAKNVSPNSNRPYGYFSELVSANLPSQRDGVSSHDIVSWYLQWPERNPRISSVRHSVRGVPDMSKFGCSITYQGNALPPLRGARQIFSFLKWLVVAVLIAGVDLLRGRWWHAVLLNQAAIAAQASLLPKDQLAAEYLFHNSNWLYRPLWTYEVEKRGAAVFFYFYSTNTEPFKRGDDYPLPYYGYEAMRWPRYLVWDEYQADFVRRVAGASAHIETVGPIWFQGNTDVVERQPGLSVAVFDVTPTRTSWYRILGLEAEYYVPETVNLFLEHVSSAVKRHQGRVLWKRKRNIGRTAHPSYRRLADSLANEPSVHLVDADVSAMRLIQACRVTVSLPFTSTALIARSLGKPSVYYDPTGTVQSDDRAAHSIPVLSGPEALEAWLANFVGDYDEVRI